MRSLSDSLRRKPDPLVRKNHSLTLVQLKIKADCREATIWRELHCMGMLLRKQLHAAEQERTDLKKLLREWKQKRRRLDFHKLVFPNETEVKTNMTRLYGRGPISKRVTESVSHGHWRTTILV